MEWMALSFRITVIIGSGLQERFSYSALGGRQVDGAIPSIYGLANVCQSNKVRAAQASGKFTVLFDSGIRNGSDIIKAIALGAQAVLSNSLPPIRTFKG
jgi:hypothetical protein